MTAAISGLVATISGKPSEVGTFNFSVTATNDESKTTVLSGKIVVNAVAPVITKPASTTISATQGVAITPITFTSDVVANFNVTGLPAGLSATTAADGKSITISGTPTGYGSSNFTVSATAYGKTSSVSGSVTVAQKLPTIDLAEGNTSQAIEVNKPISTIKYNVGDAASIDVQGLPAGVDYNVNNGIVTISGTPTETGTFNYQVIAKNDEGKASTLNGNIVVTAKAPEKAPTLVLTSGLANQTINEKEAINTITYTASGTATTIEVEDLPAGVSASINGLIAKISGTPETIGSTTYSVIATNSEGLQTTLSGTIIVNAVAPIISTPANTTIVATEGSEITPVTFSTNKVSTFEVVGLPNGLTYEVAADGKSITISGAPTEAGDFNYSVTAKADGLSSTIEGNCSIAEKPVAPEITEPTNGTQEIEVGTAIEDIVITVDKASEFEVNGLPNGLTYEVAADGKSITISGTPTEAGDFNYSVAAKADGLSNIFNGSFNITEPKDPSTGIDNATNVFQWKQTSNTISIEGANVKSMRLISLTGSLIAQSSNNSIEITSLPTGTYIVIAQLSNGQTSNYKFAK